MYCTMYSTCTNARRFVRDLLSVPCFVDRLFCLIFQSSFQEQLASMQYSLDNLKTVSEACSFTSLYICIQ